MVSHPPKLVLKLMAGPWMILHEADATILELSR